jgi:hypothetical protein
VLARWVGSYSCFDELEIFGIVGMESYGDYRNPKMQRKREPLSRRHPAIFR